MSDWEKLIRNLEENIKNDLSSLSTLKHLWYVPEANAEKGRFNGIVFLGINSGGLDIRNNDIYESFSESAGYSYYHDEVWNKGTAKGESPLQIQVRLLFLYLYKKMEGSKFEFDVTLTKMQNIARVEKEDGYEVFVKGLLAGNLCPFQSSSIDHLLYPWPLQREHLISFWTYIFESKLRGESKLIITMGQEVLDIITKVFDIHGKDLEHMASGWGNTSISIYESKNSKKPSIINLPHMSRCRIFGREKGLKYIENVFDRNIF